MRAGWLYLRSLLGGLLPRHHSATGGPSKNIPTGNKHGYLREFWAVLSLQETTKIRGLAVRKSGAGLAFKDIDGVDK